MSFRTFYLRKKYWFNDFIHGAQMWKQYYDVMKMTNCQKSTQQGGGIKEKSI